MVQFWEFDCSFNDYFNIDCTDSSKDKSSCETASERDEYLVKNDEFLTCVPEDAQVFFGKFKW